MLDAGVDHLPEERAVRDRLEGLAGRALQLLGVRREQVADELRLRRDVRQVVAPAGADPGEARDDAGRMPDEHHDLAVEPLGHPLGGEHHVGVVDQRPEAADTPVRERRRVLRHLGEVVDAAVGAQLGHDVVAQAQHVAEPGDVLRLVVRADVLIGARRRDPQDARREAGRMPAVERLVDVHDLAAAGNHARHPAATGPRHARDQDRSAQRPALLHSFTPLGYGRRRPMSSGLRHIPVSSGPAAPVPAAG